MALPAAWKIVTLTATFWRSDTQAAVGAVGSVEFVPQRTVAIDPNVVIPNRISGALNAGGQISVSLPCPNDVASQNTSMIYKVTERIPGGGRSYYIQIDNSMNAVELGDLIPVTTLDQWYSIRGAKGDPGSLFDEYSVKIDVAAGQIAVGGYYANRSLRNGGVMDRFYGEVLAGGGSATVSVYCGSTRIHGPVMINAGVPVNVSGLAMQLVAGQRVDFQVEASAGPTSLWLQIDKGAA